MGGLLSYPQYIMPSEALRGARELLLQAQGCLGVGAPIHQQTRHLGGVVFPSF